jgi:hypothetical protein
VPLVLGYHGCSRQTAHNLLGGSPFQGSTANYDWLGSGIYFWENDIDRAYAWAKARPGTPSAAPSVVGAVIDLGHCLDLTTQAGIEAVKFAHTQFTALWLQDQKVLPQNEDPPGNTSNDFVMRRLDCAVMNYLFSVQQQVVDAGLGTEFQTARALFPEGQRLYPSSGFLAQTHIQLSVRDPSTILGVFRIPNHLRLQHNLPPLYELA